MRLSAGIVYFNDREGLKRTLDSLSGFDEVITIDGAFKGYQSEERFSTDGSYELCKQYPNVRAFSVADYTQADKRSFYLQFAEMVYATHLLIIDSDEWIEGDLQEFRKNLPGQTGIYCVDYQYAKDPTYPAPRLVCNPGNFRYSGAHNIMKDLSAGATFKLLGDYDRLIKGITIHSDYKLRTPERLATSETYKKQNRAIERA